MHSVLQEYSKTYKPAHILSITMPYVQIVSSESDKLVENKQVDESELGEFVEGLYERLNPEYMIEIIHDDSERMQPP